MYRDRIIGGVRKALVAKGLPDGYTGWLLRRRYNPEQKMPVCPSCGADAMYTPVTLPGDAPTVTHSVSCARCFHFVVYAGR